MSVSDFDWSGEKILAKRKSDGQHSLEDFAVRATLGEGGFGKVELVKSQGSMDSFSLKASRLTFQGRNFGSLIKVNKERNSMQEKNLQRNTFIRLTWNSKQKLCKMKK